MADPVQRMSGINASIDNHQQKIANFAKERQEYLLGNPSASNNIVKLTLQKAALGDARIAYQGVIADAKADQEARKLELKYNPAGISPVADA